MLVAGMGLAATLLLLLPTRQPRSAVRSAGPQVEAVDWSARIFKVENFLRCALHNLVLGNGAFAWLHILRIHNTIMYLANGRLLQREGGGARD